MLLSAVLFNVFKTCAVLVVLCWIADSAFEGTKWKGKFDISAGLILITLLLSLAAGTIAKVWGY